MTIFDYIIICCKNKTCFKCNDKMIKVTKEDIIDIALNPIVCKKCNIEYATNNLNEPLVRFKYKGFIIAYDEDKYGKEYRIFYDDGLDSDEIFTLYSYEIEYKKMQTIPQLYKHLDKFIKQQIFK